MTTDEIREVPQRFIDPVTYEVMCDPVVGDDGHTYDRTVAEKLNKSPFTRAPFKILVSNIDLRSDIFERLPSVAKQFEERRLAQVATSPHVDAPSKTSGASPTLPISPLPYCPRNGSGCWETGDGRYEGEFLNGEPHGTGILRYRSGDTCDGQWRFGLPHGRTILTYANGDTYEGDVRRGAVHGKGVRTIAGVRYDTVYVRGVLKSKVRISLE